MNWPDATEGGSFEKESEIRQQNTGGESGPAHFSVIRIPGSILKAQFAHGLPGSASAKCQ
jgi:hypothetical protein